MAEFQMMFKCDNAAFDANLRAEVSRMLQIAHVKVLGGHSDGTVFDSNGNKIGSWSLDLPEADDDSE